MATNAAGGASMPAGGGGGNKRLAQQQAQVDEVVDIMRQNVDKVLERDKNLSMLDDRADKLQHNAAQFEQQAGKLKRKYWWKNMKMMIVMGIVGTIFAIVVIGWIASKVKQVAPVLPAAGPAAVNPSTSEDGAAKVVSAPVVPPTTTRRTRTRQRKKTTKAGAPAASTPGPENNEEDETNDVSKSKKKRLVRALV